MNFFPSTSVSRNVRSRGISRDGISIVAIRRYPAILKLSASEDGSADPDTEMCIEGSFNFSELNISLSHSCFIFTKREKHIRLYRDKLLRCSNDFLRLSFRYLSTRILWQNRQTWHARIFLWSIESRINGATCTRVSTWVSKRFSVQFAEKLRSGESSYLRILSAAFLPPFFLSFPLFLSPVYDNCVTFNPFRPLTLGVVRAKCIPVKIHTHVHTGA